MNNLDTKKYFGHFDNQISLLNENPYTGFIKVSKVKYDVRL